MPYSFICCSPHPSLNRLGTYFLRSPVRFGVWYMRISTLSGPNSSINGVRREAVHADGDSRVPRRASVRTLSFNAGFERRASRRVDIYGASVNMARPWGCIGYVLTNSCSVFPIYSVERKICFSAFRILSCPSISTSPASIRRTIPDTNLQRLVKLFRRPQNLHLFPPNIKPRGDFIELLCECREHRCLGSSMLYRRSRRCRRRGCRVPAALSTQGPLPAAPKLSRSSASQKTPSQHLPCPAIRGYPRQKIKK